MKAKQKGTHMNYGKQGVRSKQRALNAKSPKWGRKFALTGLKLLLAGFVGLGLSVAALGIGAFRGILEDTPQIRLSDVVASGQATIVYDCRGNEMDQYVGTNSNRIQVGWDVIPDHLGKAFVAIEDERFYQHNGIDYMGLLRSAYQFIKTMGKEKQGASTITQQLLKNTIFTDWTSENNNLVKMVKRKVQEQYLAIEISKNFTKDEVLLRYMNAINLGQNTLGVESASLRYFGKSCSELTISEAAVIACITQNPSGYNPITHPERNAKRRKDCLDKMLKWEYITKEEYDEAIADTEDVYKRIGLYDTDYKASTSTSASYFSDAVYAQVKKDLVEIGGYSQSMAETMLTSGGLRIESTMDPDIQKICDEEFVNPENFPQDSKWLLSYQLTIVDDNKQKHNYSKENMVSWYKMNNNKGFSLLFDSQDAAIAAVDNYRNNMIYELGLSPDHEDYDERVTLTPQPQSAVVVEDQRTGYIVALVGGRGTKEGRRTLNRATSALRSPGSTFKVLAAFAPALDCAGQTLATVYMDAPFNYLGGTPVRNWYDDSSTPYRGIKSIRTAIKDSLNIIAVKTLTVISPQLGFDYLQNFGFTTLEEGRYVNGKWMTDVVQPLALGGLTNGVSPYEVCGAYAAIANKGLYNEPKLYSRVTDSEGTVILDNTNPDSRRVIKDTTAFLLTSAMQDVVATGTCQFSKEMAIAGKTGTSSEYHDVWFAGFTPYYTCTTWTGYDNNVSMRTKRPNYDTGVSKMLWRSIMGRIHENLTVIREFDKPSGIVQAQICTKSGKLPFPGLCEALGCVRTEYFAENTVPTEVCDIHYQGEICAYDNLPASAECPFKHQGTCEKPLIEDDALFSGSTMITENPDGTQTITTPSTATQCQHDAAFFLNPNAYAILEQQKRERGW